MKDKDTKLLEEAYSSLRSSWNDPKAVDVKDLTRQRFDRENFKVSNIGWSDIEQFASLAYEKRRKSFDPTGQKPIIKKNSDGTEGNINVPFNELHPDWKKENLAAGRAAFDAVQNFPDIDDEEQAAEYIHNEWMKRNPKADWNAAQHVPYDQLPEEEKEKDRAQYWLMKRIVG